MKGGSIVKMEWSMSTAWRPALCFMAILIALVSPPARACSAFVEAIRQDTVRYQAGHRVWPVPDDLRALAIRNTPRLWVHPDSWHPIDFADYLDRADVVSARDGHIVAREPGPEFFGRLRAEDECDLYLRAPDIPSRRPAPIYIQVYRDRPPITGASRGQDWIYIKYNLVFDWSGLPVETGFIGDLGVLISGGDRNRWHRLDIHVSAILAFDAQRHPRVLTLAQHNYERSYLAGRDFDPSRPVDLAAAVDSNELYLDDGSTAPRDHRVVPFFDDYAFLIDGSPRPWLWAMDRVYGRHAGAEQVPLRPTFIAPDAVLATFAGHLAPPRRLFGRIYIGRDGPPGYDYYALSDGIPLPNLVALGYWREGDHDLVERLRPLMKGWRDTDWTAIIDLMRQRLTTDLPP